MGKSSKKSATNVNDAPAVTPVSKSAKKGKREAEEAIEKLVSAKKQKIDGGIKQAAQMKKSEVKTQKKKKKKEESSSSDDSSSEEEQKVKVITKNVPKATKQPVKDSSSEESSSDEEPTSKTAVPIKKQQITAKNGSVSAPAKKGKGLSSSDSSESSSEDSSSDEGAPSRSAVPTKQRQRTAKSGSFKASSKKVKGPSSSDSSESSSEESSSDEEAPSRSVPTKQQQATAKDGSVGAPAKKNKEDTSSDSSDEESDEDEVKVASNKVAKPPKAPVEDSSSEESSSDEEPSANAIRAAKRQQVDAKNGSVGDRDKKGKGESSSDSSDESDEDEEKLAQPASLAKKLPEASSKKASPSSSEESSDSETDSSSDEGTVLPTKATINKTVRQVINSKEAESSDSSDESDSDESSDEAKNAPASKVTLLATKNKAESIDSSSDESSDSDKNKMDLDKGDGEEDSLEESDDEQPKSKKAKVTTQKESSSDEESSEESSDEEESEDEKPMKTPKKNVPDVEMVDGPTPYTTNKSDFISAKKAPKTPVSPLVNSTGSKTLFVGNLSFQIERADVENFFKGAGEIVDIRFALDRDQRFKGFGHVEFATAEAAQNALKLNGQSLNGREVRLDLARERGERAPHTPYSGRENTSFQKGGRGQAQKIYVRGFDKSLGEDEIRSALGEHFKSCGDVSRISIPTDYETGYIKGMAYLEFQDADGFNKALELNGSGFGGQYLTVEEAKPPRSDKSDGWGSGRGGGRSGGGRSGGRDGGGRFGGRGGGRGRGRGTPNKPSMTATASGKKTTFNDDDE